MFALIDCNNFFVSCERLFRPDLENKPVVVLSSNDGCAVSRSAEAKALGIPMGAPAFKLAREFRLTNGSTHNFTQASATQGAAEVRSEPYMKYGKRALEVATPQRAARSPGVVGFAEDARTSMRDVVAFSANFELYGDISQRLVSLLSRVTPNIEVYSVDESFLDVSQLAIANYEQWGTELRNRILQDIGVPVSVGIAPSKTLAKLANQRAKKNPALQGVLVIEDPAEPAVRQHYQQTPVADIWGVGWRLAPKLKAEGIHTAEDLRRAYAPRIRQLMGKHGAQLIAELNGSCCLPLQTGERPHQSIMRGRTLGQEVRDEATLIAAITTLSARAAYCLRQENQLVRTATLILNTNRHKPGYQRITATARFATPTADTGSICRELSRLLTLHFNPRLGIYRVNVLFHELTSASSLKLDLFGEVDVDAHERSEARMTAFDAINSRYGKGALRPAAELLSSDWQPRRGACSPAYTTNWHDIPVARLY